MLTTSTPHTPVRVLIADSMDLILAGLHTLLHQHGGIEITGRVQSLPALLDVATLQPPDVILLGDRLEPDVDVLTLVERVQSTVPQARIIVMSGIPDGLIVHELFACGVAAYLYTSDSLSECLDDAIQAVMRRRPYLSSTANAEYLIAVQSGRTEWSLDAEARHVLRLMASGYYPQGIALERGVAVRRVYWVQEKLRNRFGAETNEQLMVRAAEEGFLP